MKHEIDYEKKEERGARECEVTIEFIASQLSARDNDERMMRYYVLEARRRGIGIVLPDVNRSIDGCDIIPGAIRLPLTSVSGVSEQACRAIIDERNSNGKFRSYDDFCRRVDKRKISKQIIENLVKADAFSMQSRYELLRAVMPELAHITMAELALMRKAVLGPYVTIRPFDKPSQAYAHELVSHEVVARLPVGSRFRTLGFVNEVSEIDDIRGRRMAFVSTWDDEDSLSVTVFASLYDCCIKTSDALHLVGRVDLYHRGYGSPEITIVATDYELLDI